MEVLGLQLKPSKHRVSAYGQDRKQGDTRRTEHWTRLIREQKNFRFSSQNCHLALNMYATCLPTVLCFIPECGFVGINTNRGERVENSRWEAGDIFEIWDIISSNRYPILHGSKVYNLTPYRLTWDQDQLISHYTHAQHAHLQLD
jgi:hypothetical protein